MKFAFIIDPIDRLNPVHDTSVALMEAAQELGHEVWITKINQLAIIHNQVWAKIQGVNLTPIERIENHWVASNPWYDIEKTILEPLESMDAVFMRQDPPITIPYLYATYLLDYINPQKTLVINSPQGLRAANEKMYTLQFTKVIPDTIVSQDKQVIREFLDSQGAAVLKPLAGKAGEGILFLEPADINFNSLIEISTKQGQEPVMIQSYLPAAKIGDKRIIILNGKPIGAVNRIPSGKEFRGNMATGGRVAQTEITQKEYEICEYLAPKLIADGLYFVGIDIIGDYLTEVNLTSPTGIREIDLLDNVNLGKQVIEWVIDKRRA
ncbi:MAG: glutathione synthase [Trichodesmium sp. MAG_R03]|nr:glutathione synthase [Trichodesmium sp. MAG_R03]